MDIFILIVNINQHKKIDLNILICLYTKIVNLLNTLKGNVLISNDVLIICCIIEYMFIENSEYV